MTIRERTEEQEFRLLAKQAAKAKTTLGRQRPEPECDLRTAFQRDRDRILHCKSFRRLKHKTQVFLSPEGDHYRTRLTHTLEVAQIARTIARCLQLNEDLTEAISLGHDLGHTPFGHAGERALDAIAPGGFRHYEQSVRVVELLENEGLGLNLTAEVRDGIRCHTTGTEAFTTEGRIVRIADRIAYINHDIDDAQRAGVLNPEEIPWDIIETLGDRRTTRINTLVSSLVANSTPERLAMAADVQEAFDALYRFMYRNVYSNPVAKGEEQKVPGLVQTLYGYCLEHTDKLPDEMRIVREREGADRAVCDYIAGMSDGFATQMFEAITVPKAWSRY